MVAGCLCVALALFWPSGRDSGKTEWVPTEKARIAHSSRTGASPPPPRNSGWYDGSQALQRQRDGHFYAEGSANGASMRFLIDSGASVVALTGADAQAAGLYWDDADISVIGTGASGAVYGVSKRLEEVEIGGIARRNVDAVIIPEGLEISLLGQSFLSQVKSVEIKNDRMILQGE